MNQFKEQKSDERQTEESKLTPAQALFRPVYRQLTAAELDLHNRIKEKAAELAELFFEVATMKGITDKTPSLMELSEDQFRERFEVVQNVDKSVAHLEDAVYRAVKGITR